MINRIVLVGRLTRDPELRKTNSGNAVASFTIAVDNRQKNPDGTKSTTFIPCTVWSNQADNVSKYCRKGSLVGVEGRLNQRNYTRKDGTNATAYEVVCDSVQFLEPKSGDRIDDAEVTSFMDESSEPESENLDSLDMPDDSLPF